MTSQALQTDLVAGRSCDGCTMCCKLLEIDVIEKPRGVWCTHCDKSRGCKIYEKRPDPCRGFLCGYLRIPHLDHSWKPSKAKFLINYEERARRIAIHADIGRPDAWRREPYYSTIKGWAAAAAQDGGYVIVWAGRHATILTQQHEKSLGEVRDDQVILAVEGPARNFIVVEPDDPRVVDPLSDRLRV